MSIVLSQRIAGGTLLSNAVADALDPQIISVNSDNTVRVGSTGNTITVQDITITSLTIGGKTVDNLIGSGDEYTFDLGGFVDTQTYPIIGSPVTAIASDGVDSPEILVTILPPQNWSVVTLTSISSGAGSVLTSFANPAQVGDQIFWLTANGTVTESGDWYGDFEGTQTLWVRSVDDGVLESYDVTTQDVEPAFTSPDSITENAQSSLVFANYPSTPSLFLENDTGDAIIEQVLSSITSTSALVTIDGNWLDVINDVPGSTVGVPFTSSVHNNIRLRLVSGSTSLTRNQVYLPPSGYVFIEYNASTANLSSSSVWSGISGLVNGSQIMVPTTVIADDIDNTELALSWNNNGLVIPSIDLPFTVDYVLLDASIFELSKRTKIYEDLDSAVISINNGDPLVPNSTFSIVLQNINANDIGLVRIVSTEKTWNLPVGSVVSDTELIVLAPNDLISGSTVDIKVYENKSSRLFRSLV